VVHIHYKWQANPLYGDEKDTNFKHPEGPHDNMGKQSNEKVLQVEVENKSKHKMNVRLKTQEVKEKIIEDNSEGVQAICS
jgi:hypothetical protein